MRHGASFKRHTFCDPLVENERHDMKHSAITLPSALVSHLILEIESASSRVQNIIRHNLTGVRGCLGAICALEGSFVSIVITALLGCVQQVRHPRLIVTSTPRSDICSSVMLQKINEKSGRVH